MPPETPPSGAASANPKQALAPAAKDAKAVNDRLKLFWIGVGTEDGAMVNAKLMSEFLTSSGIAHSFHATPGGHTWIVWRKYLNDTAPLMFPR